MKAILMQDGPWKVVEIDQMADGIEVEMDDEAPLLYGSQSQTVSTSKTTKNFIRHGNPMVVKGPGYEETFCFFLEESLVARPPRPSGAPPQQGGP